MIRILNRNQTITIYFHVGPIAVRVQCASNDFSRKVGRTQPKVAGNVKFIGFRSDWAKPRWAL